MNLPVAYLTRIGPFEGPDGASSATYLAIASDGEQLATRTESPPDDDAAVRALAATVTTHQSWCALDLANAGARHGLEVGDLPRRAAEERAFVAWMVAAGDLPAVTSETFTELCTAAAEYQSAQPWTKLAILRRFRAKHTIRLDNGTVWLEEELMLQVHGSTGPNGPRLHLAIEEGSPEAPEAGSPFRVEVTLASEPHHVASAVEGACGAYLSPRLTLMRGEMLDVARGSEALLMAAAMRASVDHLRGGKGSGRASWEQMTVELEIDFATPLPLPSRPTGKGAWDLRVIGRRLAHGLTIQAPLPRYDDYVCVVLDQRDPQTAGAMDLFDQTAAMLRATLPKGFAKVYDTAVRHEHWVGRWMQAEHMARMLAHNASLVNRLAPLHAPLPPFALRVMFFGSHMCEAYFVDFSPKDTQLRRDELRGEKRLVETGQAEREEDDADAAPVPKEIVATFRDCLAYIPDPLPDHWTIGEQRANGAVTVSIGPLSVVVAAERKDRRRWVKVYFAEHPEGRPVTREEARGVYEDLVGCGRFMEMTLTASDAEHVSLVGARLFAAALAKAPPRSVVPASRGSRDQAALIERAKAHLGEVMARVREDGGLMRDYCVILDAKKPRTGMDGVVLTRALVEDFFATPETDPFQIRARFEQPRPADECVVFVKHGDGVEEIHVSLESVERVAEVEA